MTTRSQKLASFQATAETTQKLYTCPDGWVVLLKYAYWTNFDTTPGALSFYTESSTGEAVWLDNSTLEGSSYGGWAGWLVLEPGDAVWIYFQHNNMAIWVSGAVLPIEPPLPAAQILPVGYVA